MTHEEIQAALDAGGTVVLPPGLHDLARPLWVRQHDTRLVSSGATLRGHYAGATHGVFVCADTPMAGDERPPNPMDAARIAYRLPPGRRLRCWAGPAALRPTAPRSWDAWAGVRRLTLEVAVRFHEALGDGARLMGIADGPDGEFLSPWALDAQVHVGNYLLRLALEGGTEAQVRVPCGNYQDGVRRLTIQLDLDAGTASAWDGDLQVATTSTGLTPGCRLLANQSAPFEVKGDADITLCGLRWEAVTRYASGSPIDRGDGRFFDWFGQPFVLLCDPAREVGRLALAKGHYYDEWLFVLEPYHLSPLATVRGFFMHGVTIQLPNRLGQALSLGPCYDPLVDSCHLYGGAHGLGSAAFAVSYVVVVRDSILDGSDACYHAWNQIIRLHGIRTGGGGRCILRLDGASGSVRDLLANDPDPRCEAYVVLAGTDDDGMLVVEQIGVDDESKRTGTPFKAPFLVRQRRVGSITLVVRDAAFPGKGVAVFDVDASPIGRNCRLVANNLALSAGQLAIVRSERWSADFRACGVGGERIEDFVIDT